MATCPMCSADVEDLENHKDEVHTNDVSGGDEGMDGDDTNGGDEEETM